MIRDPSLAVLKIEEIALPYLERPGLAIPFAMIGYIIMVYISYPYRTTLRRQPVPGTFPSQIRQNRIELGRREAESEHGRRIAGMEEGGRQERVEHNVYRRRPGDGYGVDYR